MKLRNEGSHGTQRKDEEVKASLEEQNEVEKE